MSTRVAGLVVFLGVGAPALTAAALRPLWLDVTPRGPEEEAFREAFEKNAFGGPVGIAQALHALSAARPGTATSGLARLGAGWLLAEAARPAEALAALQHADVERTALGDYALLARARAHEEAADWGAAGAAYRAAREARPRGAFACAALFRGAEAFARAGQADRAVEDLEKAHVSCPGQQARVLLRIAEIEDGRRNLRAAAASYDRLDREHPATPEARAAARRLAALDSLLPRTPPEARAARAAARALALADAGHHREAVPLLKAVLSRKPAVAAPDPIRLRLGRSLVALGKLSEAPPVLLAVPSDSPHAAEAALLLAQIDLRRRGRVEALEEVAQRFPGTPSAEEALIDAANHFQKDARDADALPYYRRLLLEFPVGRHVERASWRVGWADYRAGRFEDAAATFERAARLRPQSALTPGFLYWAARARGDLGQDARARQLLEEAVARFKHTYHGARAREVLAQMAPAPPVSPPALLASTGQPGLPEADAERVRQLLLIDRLDEAVEELRLLPPSAAAQATIAWVEWRRGRLRPAIVAMRRAHPESLGEAGDELPEEVWRILYPLQFQDRLQAKALERGLDPALVAALICQESTFDAGAVSRAGARGLMQVIPPTGRALARALGVRYRKRDLHDPGTSLEFGTYYLRSLLDRFGGRVERALAAYNAGPHRVEAWTAARPDMPAEEFIESIPFTETRHYVMTVLAGQAHYRRIYGLASTTGAAAAGGAGNP